MNDAADILAQAKKRRAEVAAELEQLDRMIAAAEGKAPDGQLKLVPLSPPMPCPWPHFPPSIAPHQPPTIVPMQPLEPFGPFEPFPFPYRTTCCNVVPQTTAWTGKWPTGALS